VISDLLDALKEIKNNFEKFLQEKAEGTHNSPSILKAIFSTILLIQQYQSLNRLDRAASIDRVGEERSSSLRV
jgi:hypothetical protein